MIQHPSSPKRHSFRPLLFVPTPPAASSLSPARALPRAIPPPRKQSESHVRLRSVPSPFPPPADIEWLDAQDLLDELCEDQLTLSMNLACLERIVEDAPHDPSARAAFRTLEARIADLGALRDALGAIASLSVERRFHRLFVPDAPLSDYMRGLYAWAHAITRALDTLAASLRALSPDWSLVRWRIEEAKNFHFDELFGAIREDVARLALAPRAEDLANAVDHLFDVATTLEERLDERFG